MSSLHVVYISAEIEPFAKTGGLADMVGSLGPALRHAGSEPCYIMPRYRHIPTDGFRFVEMGQEISIGSRQIPVRWWEGKSRHGVPTYLIDVPEYFDRPGIYGEGGRDYPDNAQRFIAFSRMAMECLRFRPLPVDIVHVHDWHAALVPLYIKTLAAHSSPWQRVRTICTIHNIGYQGIFPFETFALTGLPPELFRMSVAEFYGQLNCLKCGLAGADAVTTVSPSYAREVLTPEFGCRLEGVLRTRAADFVGILNGIDTTEWNPATDQHLAARYSARRMRGKMVCKEALQSEFGLPMLPDVPLVAMVCRLVQQKGVDLVAEAIPQLIDQPFQWVIVGQGEPAFEYRLRALAKQYPAQVGVRIGYDRALAHRVEAGADCFIMPSRYEPCGYNQLYSQRYGTVPIVRATGGLLDTVVDMELDPERGTGFLFPSATVADIRAALRRALTFYRQPSVWHTIRQRAMLQDFSWDRSAQAYMALYETIVSRGPTALPS